MLRLILCYFFHDSFKDWDNPRHRGAQDGYLVTETYCQRCRTPRLKTESIA